jgi:glycosyltransferase involved in cell wall biosynthesis
LVPTAGSSDLPDPFLGTRPPTSSATGAPHDSRRLSIVVDSDTFGGAERYVALLLERLPEPFVPTLLCTESVPGQLLAAAERAGTRTVMMDPVRGKSDVAGLRSLAGALRASRPELVHLNLNSPPNNPHAIAVARLLRRPTLATLHIYHPLSPRQRQLLRLLFRRLDAVIAVSAEIRHRLVKDLGVRPGAARLVHNGVGPCTAAHRPPTDTGVVRIGAQGRLTDQKGFDVLIEAVGTLVERGLRPQLLIAGDGPDRARLERLARGLPVTLLGFVDDTSSLLSAIDVFCLPSRFEGLPFALLEAMICGIPCVASRVGDVPEALGAGGLTVPPEDVGALTSALERLLTSPDLRRDLGAAARTRAEQQFSTQRMIQATVEVYGEVLSRRAAGDRR